MLLDTEGELAGGGSAPAAVAAPAAPTPGAPGPGEPGTPSPGDVTPPEPTGEEPTGEPPGEGAPAAGDAGPTPEAVLKTAQDKLGDFRSQVERIVGPLTPPAPGGAPGAPAAAAPAAPPARGPGAPFTLPEAEVRTLFERYTDQTVDNFEAFKALVNGVGTMILGAVRTDPALLDRTYQHVAQRADVAQRETAVGGVVADFWKSVAPHVPERLLWSYTREAMALHPNDLPKQVLYCLERGLKDMGPVVRRTGGSVTSPAGARASLPGGGPSRPSGGGGGEKLPTFVEQARMLRQGIKRPL